MGFIGLIIFSMLIREYSDKSEWIGEVMNKILNVVSFDSNLLIGLAGGNTPKEVYQRLGLSILDKNTWDKLHFVPIDERDVPLEDKGSNLGMIQGYMPHAHYLGFERELPDPALTMKKMDRNLRIYKQGKYIFDLLVLGMGEDGHVASIFPGFNEAKMFNPKFLSTKTSIPNNDFKDRYTLTFTALNSSKEAILLVKGKEKLDMLKLMKQGDFQLHDGNKYPIVNLLKTVPTEVFALIE
jgi:6-phosphogluconolactonase